MDWNLSNKIIKVNWFIDLYICPKAIAINPIKIYVDNFYGKSHSFSFQAREVTIYWYIAAISAIQ